jgi:hypothetical protein
VDRGQIAAGSTVSEVDTDHRNGGVEQKPA